uniref:Uncharacterized protein n=1 Tax=Octopus bimaculoides TaxID=37653 RepID=A0A0L8I130_OCTBM
MLDQDEISRGTAKEVKSLPFLVRHLVPDFYLNFFFFTHHHHHCIDIASQ